MKLFPTLNPDHENNNNSSCHWLQCTCSQRQLALQFYVTTTIKKNEKEIRPNFYKKTKARKKLKPKSTRRHACADFPWLFSVEGLWRNVSRVIWYWRRLVSWAEMAGTEVNKFLTVFYPLEHLNNLLYYFSEIPWDFRTCTSILLSCVMQKSRNWKGHCIHSTLFLSKFNSKTWLVWCCVTGSVCKLSFLLVKDPDCSPILNDLYVFKSEINVNECKESWWLPNDIDRVVALSVLIFFHKQFSNLKTDKWSGEHWKGLYENVFHTISWMVVSRFLSSEIEEIEEFECYSLFIQVIHLCHRDMICVSSRSTSSW